MKNDGLIKTYIAAGAIPAYRIVAYGATDTEAALATAATDSILGVSDLGVGAGDRVDVHHSQIAFVEYGGTVSRGDWLTTDATGRAIATTTAGNETIGKAAKSGVVGDIGSVEIIKQRY